MVTLRCAQGRARWAARCFAALSMTGRSLPAALLPSFVTLSAAKGRARSDVVRWVKSVNPTCHPEHSEGSGSIGTKMLSAAKHDRAVLLAALRQGERGPRLSLVAVDKSAPTNHLVCGRAASVSSPCTFSVSNSSGSGAGEVRRIKVTRNMSRMRTCRPLHQAQMAWSRTIST